MATLCPVKECVATMIGREVRMKANSDQTPVSLE